MILGGYLLQGLGEIADERTANTAGIHFRNIDSRVLQKSAVNPDFTEFVFYQNDLFARIGLFNELFDQRCFSRAQKSRKYIYFCHDSTSFLSDIPLYINAEPRFSNAGSAK